MRGAFERLAVRRSHQEGVTERSGKPMGLAPSRQLIDSHTTVLMPVASSRQESGIGRIARKRFLQLTPTTHEPVKVGQVGVDLGSLALVHHRFESPTTCRREDWGEPKHPEKEGFVCSVGSKLKCPLFVASEMSGFK